MEQSGDSNLQPRLDTKGTCICTYDGQKTFSTLAFGKHLKNFEGPSTLNVKKTGVCCKLNSVDARIPTDMSGTEYRRRVNELGELIWA